MDAEADGFPYAAPQAGTQPFRSALPGLDDEGLGIRARSRGFPDLVAAAGKMEAGTAPQRPTMALRRVALVLPFPLLDTCSAALYAAPGPMPINWVEARFFS